MKRRTLKVDPESSNGMRATITKLGYLSISSTRIIKFVIEEEEKE
jgi:hypothetical protein